MQILDLWILFCEHNLKIGGFILEIYYNLCKKSTKKMPPLSCGRSHFHHWFGLCKCCVGPRQNSYIVIIVVQECTVDACVRTGFPVSSDSRGSCGSLLKEVSSNSVLKHVSLFLFI